LLHQCRLCGADGLFHGHRDDDGGGDFAGESFGVEVFDQLGQGPSPAVRPVDIGPIRVPTHTPTRADPEGGTRGVSCGGAVGGVAGGGVQVGSDRPVSQVTGSGLTIRQHRFGGLAEVVPPGCGHRLQDFAQHPRGEGRQQRVEFRGPITEVLHGDRRQPVGPGLLIEQLGFDMVSDFLGGAFGVGEGELRRPRQPTRIQHLGFLDQGGFDLRPLNVSQRLREFVHRRGDDPRTSTRNVTGIERRPGRSQSLSSKRGRQDHIPCRASPITTGG